VAKVNVAKSHLLTAAARPNSWPSTTSPPYGSCVQPSPGGTTSPCAFIATVRPAPYLRRTIRFVIVSRPAALTVGAGTECFSASKPNAFSRSAARSACGALLPGGVSVGTRTSSCRKRTSSSKWASIQASSAS